MASPVDLTNLRSMTEGNKAIEAEVFGEFITSFEDGIARLKQHCLDSNQDAWKKCAHALKGIALNLGAERLGDLCNLAQEESSIAAKGKNEMIRYIEEEYSKVKHFLKEAA